MNTLQIIFPLSCLCFSCSDSKIDSELEGEIRSRLDRIESIDSGITELNSDIASMIDELELLEEHVTKIEDERREEWKRLLKERKDLAGWISLQGDVNTQEIQNALKQQSLEIERLRKLLKEHSIESEPTR